MKILYYGGQKSGKSRLAEQKAIELTYDKKPYYIATYDNSYNDVEMQERLYTHQWQREDNFITIEEPFDLPLVINNRGTYLIDCLSMWILNTLDIEKEELFRQLENLSKKESNIIFVLNEVNSGVIPIDNQSRQFVDRTGVIGQWVSAFCDEVYEVKLGIPIKLKTHHSEN
jgi:adenosylcobinamide kinase/adenosylcobinamide-phosphate guanylyltransferase